MATQSYSMCPSACESDWQAVRARPLFRTGPTPPLRTGSYMDVCSGLATGILTDKLCAQLGGNIMYLCIYYIQQPIANISVPSLHDLLVINTVYVCTLFTHFLLSPHKGRNATLGPSTSHLPPGLLKLTLGWTPSR